MLVIAVRLMRRPPRPQQLGAHLRACDERRPRASIVRRGAARLPATRRLLRRWQRREGKDDVTQRLDVVDEEEEGGDECEG